MTENNNFLISNKRHCENFQERKKKEKKRKKSQNIFLRNYFRCIRKNSGETFARNFSLLSGIVNCTIRGIHVSKRSKATITFVSTSYLVNPRKNSKGTDIKIDIQNESSLRLANLEAYTTRSIDTLIYLYTEKG